MDAQWIIFILKILGSVSPIGFTDDISDCARLVLPLVTVGGHFRRWQLFLSSIVLGHFSIHLLIEEYLLLGLVNFLAGLELLHREEDTALAVTVGLESPITQAPRPILGVARLPLVRHLPLLPTIVHGSKLRVLALILNGRLNHSARLHSVRVLGPIVQQQLLGLGRLILIVSDQNLSALPFNLPEELLRVAPDLRARPGRDILLDALPVFAK